MRTSTPTTPLLSILRHLNAEQRAEFAALAGTKVDYLYQLSGCNRKSCRSQLAKSIADASVAMRRKYGSPTITMETLATMCSDRNCSVAGRS